VLDLNTKLNVFLKSGEIYTDYSDYAFDLLRDGYDLVTDTTDYLYIGFRKPIASLYLNFQTLNTQANTLSLEYWNGTAWVAMVDVYDDTKGFTRNGFIEWSVNQGSEYGEDDSDWDELEVNSITKYWLRLHPSVKHSSGTEIMGIGIVFSDDQDLSVEVPLIMDELFTDANWANGETSYIRLHCAARDEIVQYLRNKNVFTVGSSEVIKRDLTAWDFLQIDQVKKASVFCVLSKIFANCSDSVDDKYYQKSKFYNDKFQSIITSLQSLYLDTDSDGSVDSAERNNELSFKRGSR